MWALIIALWISGSPPELKYTKLAEMKTYQECKELSNTLKKHGLNANLFCVEQQ